MKRILVAIGLFLFLQNAWAVDIHTAKDQGLVGEANTGYLAAVKKPASAEVEMTSPPGWQRVMPWLVAVAAIVALATTLLVGRGAQVAVLEELEHRHRADEVDHRVHQRQVALLGRAASVCEVVRGHALQHHGGGGAVGDAVRDLHQ